MSNLATCDTEIIRVFNEAILHRDISITCGTRLKKEQDRLYLLGRTKVQFPDSKHNSNPSRAIDVIPYPTTDEDWEDRIYWIEWSSWVKGFALGIGVPLISGFDWDNDYDYGEDEQTFWDGPHFERPNGD